MLIVKALIAVVIGFILWAIWKLKTAVFGGEEPSLLGCIGFGIFFSPIVTAIVTDWLFGV